MDDCCAGKGNGKGSYDLAVIGAGSAGFSAAIAAAEQGAQVALIGHGTIGGTCVNIGCVPSKTMIRAAETSHQAKTAKRFRGIEAHAKVADWSAVMAEKRPSSKAFAKRNISTCCPPIIRWRIWRDAPN